MNTTRPPPPSSSSSSSSSSTQFSPTLLCASIPISSSKPRFPTRANPTSNSSDVSLSTTTTTAIEALNPPPNNPQDQTLLTLLRQRKTEQAWAIYAQSTTHLPNPTCLSRLVSQLSYQNTQLSLTRAQSIVHRLRLERQLHRLDANSLGLLAVAAAKSGHTNYASSVIKSMLKSGYLPHVKAWSAVVSRLPPPEAVALFASVTRRIRRFPDPDVVGDSRPDTAAYNAALNACADLGDYLLFRQLFDEMPELNCEPDVLTYNIMIKLCARANRKDLIVYVLERILEKEIELCMTTLQSLVAAYVGFGDLEMAEKVVQAMREGRRDLCKILKDSNNKVTHVENGKLVFDKLLPNSVTPSDGGGDPPLLNKTYVPNCRMYTTLMKGYMKSGRVSDTVRMLEAMRHQEDAASQPDNVTYTTVVSAFVKVGAMDKARLVLAEMTRIGVPANRVTYNILLKGYCHQLQIGKAKELMKEMSGDVGVEPDVISYNTMIDGCILVDDSSGALSYFNEMRGRGIAPSKVSYTTLMKAFALAGQPKLANKVFDEMLKDPRVKVDLIAWNMLVEGYCRLGLIEEAKSIVERMRNDGFLPNVSTYGSLANGIALARKPGEALLLWNEVKERCDPEITKMPLTPDEGLLDTLADICVRAAFFKKALEIVACMEENGISPNKTKFTRIYVEMHSRMFTSKHASRARQDRRKEKKRAAEAFKFWLGLPNSYYGSEWRLEAAEGEYNGSDSD